jgi:hypothetical protein
MEEYSFKANCEKNFYVILFKAIMFHLMIFNCWNKRESPPFKTQKYSLIQVQEKC